MKLLHRFMKDFFCEDNWHIQYKPADTPFKYWIDFSYDWSPDERCKTKTFLLRIPQRRMYSLYKSFCGEFYPKSKFRNVNTFWEEIEMVGVERCSTRKVVKSLFDSDQTQSRMIAIIRWPRFVKAMGILYPELPMTTWSHLDASQAFGNPSVPVNEATFNKNILARWDNDNKY